MTWDKGKRKRMIMTARSLTEEKIHTKLSNNTVIINPQKFSQIQ